MSTITILCDACQERQPSHNFSEGGRVDSLCGRWICRRCNACPDCGQSLGDGRCLAHRCHVPLLTTALGVELTSREKRLIGWLCNSIERRDAETLAELFRRSRRALAPERS